MRWMRNIALVLSFVLCWVGINTEHADGLVTLREADQNPSQVSLAQEVLHDYLDLMQARAFQNTSPQTLTLRIPHKKGSSRHFDWLSMRATAHTNTYPIFHGGYQDPKTVAKRQMLTELSRLCRLII